MPQRQSIKMNPQTSTALAHPNIAFIKYWGNRNDSLHLPSNGSISMCLAGLTTRTQVAFDPALTQDSLTLDGEPVQGKGLTRVQAFLDHVRTLAGKNIYAHVESANNFPTGVGIASSASGFAALALAATHALCLQLSEKGLSRLARLGSGSACRSVPSGFVEWQAGDRDSDSFAFSIAPPVHWHLADCIAIIDTTPKTISSAEGMAHAHTSPLQADRLVTAPERLARCRQAILTKDFEAFADVLELDSALMHEVMRTSTPSMVYMQPLTSAILAQVKAWRAQGHAVCATVDAGPNVHVICPAEEQEAIVKKLRVLPGVIAVLSAKPGGGAKLESAYTLHLGIN